MVTWSLFFLIGALVFYAGSLKLIMGKLITDGKFIAAIFMILFSPLFFPRPFR